MASIPRLPMRTVMTEENSREELSPQNREVSLKKVIFFSYFIQHFYKIFIQ